MAAVREIADKLDSVAAELEVELDEETTQMVSALRSSPDSSERLHRSRGASAARRDSPFDGEWILLAPALVWTECRTNTGKEVDDVAAPHDLTISAAPEAGDQVVAALSLGPVRRDTGIEPLRLGTLRLDASDRSMIHTLGHVDASGRVSARSLLSVLGWQAAERLSVRAYHQMVLLQRRRCGRERVRSSQFVTVPAGARTAAGIEVGESVLITAVLKYDLLVVHSQASVDEMVLAQVCSRASAS